MAFNPKGKGYDYKSAIKAGMRHKAHGRTSPANITQHWGSVAPATRKETMTGNLPKGKSFNIQVLITSYIGLLITHSVCCIMFTDL